MGNGLYNIVHEKANALVAILSEGEQLLALLKLENTTHEKVIDALKKAVKNRQEGMDEVDLLDKRIAFLSSSGYTPDKEELERINVDKRLWNLTLKRIMDVEDKVNECLKSKHEELSDRIRQVRDAQKSMHAYSLMPEEAEARELSVFR